MEVGLENVIDEARRFGVTTDVAPVPSISIGAADVVPLEIISAYTAFANDGQRAEPQAILRVEDRDGNILWQPTVRRIQVLEPSVAWLITDVLRDVVRRGTAAGTVGAQINFTAAGKTGTTNDGFDVWFVGFTPELVTGVWIGFDQPKKIMNNAQGGRLAAPAWTTMMKEVYDRRSTSLLVESPGGPAGGRDRQHHRLPGDAILSDGRCGTWRASRPARCPTTYCPVHSQMLGVPGMTPSAEAIPGATAGQSARHGAARRVPPALRLQRALRGRRHGRPGSPRRRDTPALMPPRRLAADWVFPAVAPPIRDGAVLIDEQGYVAAIGPDVGGEVPTPPGIPTEYFPDAALLPGFINAHTHLELTGLGSPARRARFPLVDSPAPCPEGGAHSGAVPRGGEAGHSGLLGRRRHHRRRYRRHRRRGSRPR